MLKNDLTAECREHQLPHNRAFVVQFSSQTDFASNSVQGRAEHIATGTVLHFQSAGELLAFTARTLRGRSL